MIKEYTLHAICNGQIAGMEEMAYSAYLRKWIGEGIAFVMKPGDILAPASGIVGPLPENFQSINLTLENGMKLSLNFGHVLEKAGTKFEILCTANQPVQQGQPLARITGSEKEDLVVPMLIRLHQDFYDFQFLAPQQKPIIAGETVIARYQRRV